MLFLAKGRWITTFLIGASQAGLRVKEAAQMGFTRCILPARNLGTVSVIRQALRWCTGYGIRWAGRGKGNPGRGGERGLQRAACLPKPLALSGIAWSRCSMASGTGHGVA